MNRIAITGSFETRKSALSLALSNLTGFQYIRPVTDYELREKFINYNMVSDQFYTHYLNCLFKLSDRLKNESLAESCFISDGCILNEVAYLKAYYEISKSGSNKRKIKKEQSLMILSIENSVIYHFRDRYNRIIKLNSSNLIAEKSESTLLFRQLYDTFLEEMLYKSGFPFNIYQVDDIELAINKIIKDEGFENKISVNEAIYKANLNISGLNSFIEVAEIY